MAKIFKMIFGLGFQLVYFISFLIFSFIAFIFYFLLPNLKTGPIDELIIIGFISGVFLQFGVRPKKFIYSVLFFTAILSIFTVLIFFVVKYLQSPQESLFRYKDLLPELKYFSLFILSFLLPPHFGFGFIYVLRLLIGKFLRKGTPV